MAAFGSRLFAMDMAIGLVVIIAWGLGTAHLRLRRRRGYETRAFGVCPVCGTPVPRPAAPGRYLFYLECCEQAYLGRRRAEPA